MNGLLTSIVFPALGGKVAIQAEGAGAEAAVEESRELVLDLHDRLTRFEPGSELSRLNRNPEAVVEASPLMLRFAEAVGFAGRRSGGLVDATLLDQVERAGYIDTIDPDAGPLELEPPAGKLPGQADRSDWSAVSVDRDRQRIARPPGLRLDSGGIGKGLAADIVAERLQDFESWAVECSGDLRFGGTRGAIRRIEVKSPIQGGGIIATCEAASGAVATSGTTRRSWDTGDGRAHHLIDPRTGLSSRTGIIQVTAVAATGVEAEVRTKSALLSGPGEAAGWLPDGGVVVTDRLEVKTLGFDQGTGL